MPWSIEATAAMRQAPALAATGGGHVTLPLHLLVALGQGTGPIADALGEHGPFPVAVTADAGDGERQAREDSLRLPQVAGAAEELARGRGESVLPAHLLVALLDQDDPDVRQALATNQLDEGTLRRAALRLLGAPEELPPLRMPDVRWAPL